MSQFETVQLLTEALEAIRYGTTTIGGEFDLSYTQKAVDTMQAIKDALRTLGAPAL